ncbi:MAG: (2Fe-2S)-binding protein [Acidimicrobiia bacterium]
MTDGVLTLEINGEQRSAIIDTNRTLLEFLREDLSMTGTKHGCDLGECGTCTVLVDGKPVLSCITLAWQVAGSTITTIEGLSDGRFPDELQTAFAELNAAQCGYCTPGMILSARSLLDRNPDPSTDEINEALAGNLCRCTGYVKIISAVHLAATRSAPESG